MIDVRQAVGLTVVVLANALLIGTALRSTSASTSRIDRLIPGPQPPMGRR